MTRAVGGASSTNSFTGWYGTDGVTWQQVGSNATVNMASAAEVGLAVTSRNNNLIGGATFTNAGVVTTQVTNNLDSGAGSLRQALLNAATIPGPPQTIRFTFPALAFKWLRTISRLRAFLMDAAVGSTGVWI